MDAKRKENKERERQCELNPRLLSVLRIDWARDMKASSRARYVYVHVHVYVCVYPCPRRCTIPSR